MNGVGFGVQNPNITKHMPDNSDKTGTITTLSSGFSIMETIDVTLNGLSNQVNYSSNTTLTQTITQSVVPEPSTFAIAGLALWA